MRVTYYTLLEKPRGSIRLTSCTLNENSDFIVFNEKTLLLNSSTVFKPKVYSVHEHPIKLASKQILFL